VRAEAGQPATIEAVVFDIGRVLVRLEYAELLALFGRHGIDTARLDDLLMDIDLPGYERGDFDGEELLARIAARGDGAMSLVTLRKHWLGMFVPEQSMIDLARRLAATHRVYLLSNIGDLHWEFLNRRLDIAAIGHGALPSFQAGACKPDPAIYGRAEALFGLSPPRTVFIDDLKANVETARRRGWHGIHHVDPGSTIAGLRRLGVDA
jgi:FMN phosphatase YigB (HAD superfamily)